MGQVRIKGINREVVKRKFLKKYPNQKIYDITREFVSYKIPKKDRIYRVTGIKKEK